MGRLSSWEILPLTTLNVTEVLGYMYPNPAHLLLLPVRSIPVDSFLGCTHLFPIQRTADQSWMLMGTPPLRHPLRLCPSIAQIPQPALPLKLPFLWRHRLNLAWP